MLEEEEYILYLQSNDGLLFCFEKIMSYILLRKAEIVV